MTVPFDSLLSLLRDPSSRQRNDDSATREHNFRKFDHGLPAGLEVQWLGTAGFALTCEGTRVLIDPYVSRRGMMTLLKTKSLGANPGLVDRLVEHCDAILVGHTHFDHAVDVPYLAQRDGCRAYGSTSLRQLMTLHGLSDQTEVVQHGKTYEVGPFQITFYESLHSKLALGLAVPSGGELTCDHLDDLGAGQYRSGQVWGIHIEVAGTTFYHQGSCNLIEERIGARNVDYFLCGIAGRGFTDDYTARILRALEPRTVVLCHHDNFFRPLDAPMGFSLNVNAGGFIDEVRAVSGDFAVRSLDLLQRIQG